VQAFRRDNSFYESARLKLRGLEPTGRYAVAHLDTPTARQEFTGSELMERGLLVEIPGQPAAAVIAYRKVK
jgi:hypothetical protein